ncbi:hypothetical protein HMPREF1316_2278 [Olsenella profusa F0195]|uniref:Uncharacterized protein n=1 Tax=Olsenella profusa F0195 TaxID=1125712 RepID=U2TNE9_9ACTN|nr:hypothetical protein HMPREF1316_2278 [Olsenella profusa F0195]
MPVPVGGAVRLGLSFDQRSTWPHHVLSRARMFAANRKPHITARYLWLTTTSVA